MIDAQKPENVRNLLEALQYIAHPTMGNPGQPAAEFAREGATESHVRSALVTCIKIAGQILEDTLAGDDYLDTIIALSRAVVHDSTHKTIDLKEPTGKVYCLQCKKELHV